MESSENLISLLEKAFSEQNSDLKNEEELKLMINLFLTQIRMQSQKESKKFKKQNNQYNEMKDSIEKLSQIKSNLKHELHHLKHKAVIEKISPRTIGSLSDLKVLPRSYSKKGNTLKQQDQEKDKDKKGKEEEQGFEKEKEKKNDKEIQNENKNIINFDEFFNTAKVRNKLEQILTETTSSSQELLDLEKKRKQLLIKNQQDRRLLNSLNQEISFITNKSREFETYFNIPKIANENISKISNELPSPLYTLYHSIIFYIESKKDKHFGNQAKKNQQEITNKYVNENLDQGMEIEKKKQKEKEFEEDKEKKEQEEIDQIEQNEEEDKGNGNGNQNENGNGEKNHILINIKIEKQLTLKGEILTSTERSLGKTITLFPLKVVLIIENDLPISFSFIPELDLITVKSPQIGLLKNLFFKENGFLFNLDYETVGYPFLWAQPLGKSNTVTPLHFGPKINLSKVISKINTRFSIQKNLKEKIQLLIANGMDYLVQFGGKDCLEILQKQESDKKSNDNEDDDVEKGFEIEFKEKFENIKIVNTKRSETILELQITDNKHPAINCKVVIPQDFPNTLPQFHLSIEKIENGNNKNKKLNKLNSKGILNNELNLQNLNPKIIINKDALKYNPKNANNDLQLIETEINVNYPLHFLENRFEPDENLIFKLLFHLLKCVHWMHSRKRSGKSRSFLKK
ncbi:tho complex subunit 5 [Anaeramoeba flamelloides]|uniref:Tho complex subunit 5 n=1 Tax=Anaeramoeba flamelloides TaxID=1746091 RepID=A0AAV7ZEN6_9EUKA|nr:tho complex subunit 5 [Anaeramoeba flamelloides]